MLPSGGRVVQSLAGRHHRRRFDCSSGPRPISQAVGVAGRTEIRGRAVRAGRAARHAGAGLLHAIGIERGCQPDRAGSGGPRYPQLPVTLIGRLAVDARVKRQRLGEYLLMDALYRNMQPRSRRWRSWSTRRTKSLGRSTATSTSYPLQASANRLYLPMKAVVTLFE